MKINKNIISNMLSLAVAAVLTASCGIGRSPDSSFYSLVSSASSPYSEKADFADLTVVIKNVVLPSYLNRPQIVLREADGTKMNISELNRWAGNLSDNIKSVLAEDMSVILNGASVKPLMFGDRDYKYSVSLEINRFDTFTDGRVELVAWWNINYGQNFSQNINGQFKSTKMSKGTYDDMVKVQSEMLAELSLILSKEIIKLEH